MNTKYSQPMLSILLLVLVAIFSGCGDDNSVERIPVGVVLPLSGSLEKLGAGLKNAAELALEEANSGRTKQIEFIIEDSKSSAEGAVEAFNKLIGQDLVTAIIGPVTSSETQAAFPIAQQNLVVGFSPLAAASGLSEIGDYVFQGNLTVDVVIPGGVTQTQEKFGYQNVAVLVDELDVFSQSAYEILEETFNEEGLVILAKEVLETGDTDFTAQLTRISDLAPDAIFISTLPIEAVEILKQMQGNGISDDVTVIIPFAFSTGEIELAGDAAEGVVTFSTWVSSAPTPGNQAFVDNYQNRFGSEPSRFVAQEYAAVHIFAQALFSAQSFDSFTIRDALKKVQDIDTILGKFSFSENGQAVYKPILLVVTDGEFKVLQ